MADVLLFHSVLGLRPGVQHFAEQLKSAGHKVTTPDLYDGEVFNSYDAGGKKWAEIGIPAMLQKAQAESENMPTGTVFAGFSNGAALAEFLAGTHPDSGGAVLMHGALPIEALQITAWPNKVPVQLHYNKEDPMRDPKNEVALEKAVKASGGRFEGFLYDGNTHLFADPELPDYNAESAKLMVERVLRMLKFLDETKAA
jgi:dienelactone hydrolase